MANEEKMPRPIQISGSRVGWVEEELENWLLNISSTNFRGGSNES
jgi:predicted DNA-binding transcriptional regulator AlpA